MLFEQLCVFTLHFICCLRFSFCLSVCLTVFMSVCLSVCLPPTPLSVVCLSVCLYVRKRRKKYAKRRVFIIIYFYFLVYSLQIHIIYNFYSILFYSSLFNNLQWLATSKHLFGYLGQRKLHFCSLICPKVVTF